MNTYNENKVTSSTITIIHSDPLVLLKQKRPQLGAFEVKYSLKS